MRQPNMKLEALFEAAVALDTDGQRAAYLDRACPDPELRREVESLLAAHQNPDSVLAERTIRVEPASSENVGTVIGRYKLLETLGEGGCGVVWLAEQKEPVRRKVALKVIKLGMDTKQVVARFEAERQALALMDHPNIAKVLDAGTTEAGRPYFVMELVRGIPVTQFCDENKLATRERLDLFIKVCHAVQHAHQKGIIHRDLKPSNVLVTLHDGVPVPKVIDFGIAKATQQELTDKTIHTMFQQFIGTPAYVSPEQAEMSGLDIDTRSDIYSLGVLLYELLTGVTPFDGKELLASGLDEMRRTIREKEPVRPSTRISHLQATSSSAQRATCHSSLATDLDWIVMRCLEKDRARRYETANGLAADLKRHLNGEPVVARPPSTTYRFQKMVRRNKLAFAAAGAVLAALVLGLAVAVIGLGRERQAKRRAVVAEQDAVTERNNAVAQRQRAEASERESRLNLYASDMKLTMQAWEAGAIERARQLLEAHRPKPSQPDLRGFDWRLLWKLCQQPEPFTLPESHPVVFTALSPDGRWLAEGDSRGGLRLWNLLSRQFVELKGHQLPIGTLAFSPDSRWLASGSGGLFHPNQPGELKLWDVSAARLSRDLPGHTLRINTVTFACDSRRLISTGADNTVRAWDVATGQPVPGLVPPEVEGLWMVASPTERVVAAGSGATVRLLDLDTGRLIHAWSNHAHTVWGAAFSRDGRRLATGGSDTLVFIHDVARGQIMAVLPMANVVSAVAFSPDGATLACGTIDKVTLWDVARRREFGAIRGLKGGAICLDFTRDGSTLAVSAESQAPQLWDVRQVTAGGHVWKYESNGVQALAISPDGRRLAVGEGDFYQPYKPSDIHLRELASDREIGVFKGHTASVGLLAFGPNGRTLISGSFDGTTRLWQMPSGQAAPFPGSTNGHWGTLAAVSPQGRLATYRKVEPPATNTLAILDPATGHVLATFSSVLANMGSVPVVCFSADGSLVAAMGETNEVSVWEVTSQRRVATLPQADGLTALSISPDGRFLATGSEGKRVRLLDLRSGQVLLDIEGHRHVVTALAFSPDGARLVSASVDSTIKLWAVPSGHELITLTGHQANINALVFTPDGNKLISGSADGEVRFWRAAKPQEIASSDASIEATQ